MTERYLSVTEVAQLLGISTAAASVYRLPEPDATIGRTRGWKRQTVETWNAARPGRGVGGGRPRSRS
ncbi:helix-turn-helix transcriptional regulator [Bifidobacterium thermophilum]|uniref:helix-turn-helix transcriptional regulator n=1 Tax=Bifidobacterium thermophilum TaxID=33905 RepID=UPI003F911487